MDCASLSRDVLITRIRKMYPLIEPDSREKAVNFRRLDC